MVHTTPQTETVAASVDRLAPAVKHAVPQSVTRSSTIDAVVAAAAARHRLAADGPAGTARKPPTAVNTTAAMESTKHGSGSRWVRRRTTAATAAADANTADVTALPNAPEATPERSSVNPPAPTAHRQAAAPMIRAACSPSPCGEVLATAPAGSARTGSAAGMAVVESNSSSPSRTSHSHNVIESSRDDPPTRDRRQLRAAASVGQSPSRWTMSTIDGSSRATGVRVGRARSTATSRSPWVACTDTRRRSSATTSPPGWRPRCHGNPPRRDGCAAISAPVDGTKTGLQASITRWISHASHGCRFLRFRTARSPCMRPRTCRGLFR